ncbi:MAG: hypothetical protein CMG75_06050 [Candidatus Marinimicrobia bacterium]|nr:hypothetical protein [Candidatus Neomarinimicrobiota bacterium]|tara:strand:- start:11839 stop:13479 length:1641 start_codon:yes stop_codon:yes gene_type:complete
MKNRLYKRYPIFISILLFIIISFAQSDVYRDVSSNWRLVYEVYKRIMTDYADQIDPKKLASAGIEGMLEALDPYSVFLEKNDRHQITVLTQGNYGGVGIQMSVRDDSLTVIAPMDDSPAQKAGIRSGDKIIAVDDLLTSDMKMDEAAEKIRGAKGTIVKLTVRRWGENDIDYSLTRSTIKIKDVSYSGMIDRITGYLRLNRFSRNSSAEMREALMSLDNQGAERIILDLRGNPGGLMDAAVSIVDMFVKPGLEIVSMSGRSDKSARSFKSQSEPIIGEKVKLAVLIDGGSASASEIVAGAIQDLDRGIVVGNISFGKGLVQTAFQLDESKTLKMTTAKYYIPSGRLIQKPDYLRTDVAKGDETSDSIFVTTNGRKVIANGGINPDFLIEEAKTPLLTSEIWRKGLFFQFSSRYVKEKELDAPVIITDPVVVDFQDFLDSKKLNPKSEVKTHIDKLEELLTDDIGSDKRVEHSISVLKKYYEVDKDQMFQNEIDNIRLMLKRNLSWVIGGLSGRIESSFDDDPAILKAIEVLSDDIVYGFTLDPFKN